MKNGVGAESLKFVTVTFTKVLSFGTVTFL